MYLRGFFLQTILKDLVDSCKEIVAKRGYGLDEDEEEPGSVCAFFISTCRCLLPIHDTCISALYLYSLTAPVR